MTTRYQLQVRNQFTFKAKSKVLARILTSNVSALPFINIASHLLVKIKMAVT